jgi:hypothetical protein
MQMQIEPSILQRNPNYAHLDKWSYSPSTVFPWYVQRPQNFDVYTFFQPNRAGMVPWFTSFFIKKLPSLPSYYAVLSLRSSNQELLDHVQKIKCNFLDLHVPVSKFYNRSFMQVHRTYRRSPSELVFLVAYVSLGEIKKLQKMYPDLSIKVEWVNFDIKTIFSITYSKKFDLYNKVQIDKCVSFEEFQAELEKKDVTFVLKNDESYQSDWYAKMKEMS